MNLLLEMGKRNQGKPAKEREPRMTALNFGMLLTNPARLCIRFSRIR